MFGLTTSGYAASTNQWQQVDKMGSPMVAAYGLTVVGQKAYVGMDQGTSIASLNAYSSENQWEPMNQGIQGTTVYTLLADNNTLYAGTNGNGVYRYNLGCKSNCTWQQLAANTPFQTVYDMVINGSQLYAATDSGVFSYNITEPNAAWVQIPLLGPHIYITALAIEGSTLYAAPESGHGVYAYDLTAKAWSPVGQLSNNADINSMVVANHVLYASVNQSLESYNLQGGPQAQWKARQVISGEDNWLTKLLAHDGKLYIGSSNGDVDVLDLNDPNAPVQSYNQGLPNDHAPIADIISDNNGYLFLAAGFDVFRRAI